MRLARLLTLLAACALAALAAAPQAVRAEPGPLRASAAAADEDPSGARVIVKYRALGTLMRALSAGTTPAAGPRYAGTLGQRHGLALRDGIAVDRQTQVVRGDRSLSSAALAARLAADPEVEYAVPDLRRHALAVPNDALYGNYAGTPPPMPSGDVAVAAGQWYLRPPDSTFIAAIDAQDAWSITTGAAGVVVADVDTGVLFGHPDLANKLLPGRNFVSTNGSSALGWSADASDPGDFTTAGQCGSGQAAEPSSWHGTQTSSLIGAQTNNGIGMASVGYNVMVLPVRVLGPCGGYDSDILAGMLWAGGVSSNPVPNPTPARVINMSLGGGGSCSAAYSSAIGQLNAAGVVVVVAAGNDEGLAVSAPANCPGVIAVAGVRHVGTKVGFSSVGPQVAIAAPAGNCVNTTGACLYPILTATNTGTASPDAAGYTYSDSTNYSVGTSFATPLVSGTAALMLSANPALTPAQVKTLLQNGARPFPAQPAGSTVPVCQPPSALAQDECYCTTSTCGAGLLNTNAAVAAAVAGAQPTVSIAASSATVTDGATVTFTANASAPGSRSIAAYQWAITSGSAIAAFSGPTNATTANAVTRGVGSFTATLTVTDSAGQSASVSSNVTVNAPAAPTARILASASVVVAGSSITLDGSGSTVAAPVTISGYQWTIASGNALASFSSATNAATATLATLGTGAGSVTVQLTVTDSLARQSSTTQTVSVTSSQPTASIAASAASVTAGGSVTFGASASLVPGGRTIAGYQWTITSGAAIAALSGSATGVTATVATSAAGTFTVQLTVTDSSGAQGSQTSTVTVSAASAPPASGGSGGGPMSPPWLLGLGVAVAALARTRPRPAP